MFLKYDFYVHEDARRKLILKINGFQIIKFREFGKFGSYVK